MYQLVDGHNFDISLSLFLSTLLLFSKKAQNSATVFEVRHGKLRKETTQGKVLQTISKFFGGKLQCIFFYAEETFVYGLLIKHFKRLFSHGHLQCLWRYY